MPGPHDASGSDDSDPQLVIVGSAHLIMGGFIETRSPLVNRELDLTTAGKRRSRIA
jgi:hypothetical protein